MLFARKDDKTIMAFPKAKATCPHCNEDVISKCGDINIWHWAHIQKCSYSTEPETKWHLDWKGLAYSYNLDIEYRFEKHITDAINQQKKICYEFQHSFLAPEDLIVRSLYYRNRGYRTVWIFDFSEKLIKGQFNFRKKNNALIFSQKYPRKNILSLFEKDKPLFGQVYFDIGEVCIDIKKLYTNGNGWGYEKHSGEVFYQISLDIKGG